jgi:hypothetical protein
MPEGLTLTAFQGDAAGATIGRLPNEIVLTVLAASTGVPVGGLAPNQVVVNPMTPTATPNGIVTTVIPGPIPGSYRIVFGQRAGGTMWAAGVHLFAVWVGVPSGGGALVEGVTLATALVCHPEQVERPIEPTDPNRPSS